ncbi:MAG TPA: PEP-CTERM sorting domain-containing protein [Pirellulales bacterium]
MTPIAPTTANRGNYAAGSWLTLSGSISATASGLTATGNFATESGQGASGSFSTGNPGSLVSFYGGNLLANVDLYSNTISFPTGSTISAGIYNAKYPEVANPAVPLTPAVGGGIAGTPGSAAANYGVAITLKALGFITAASGTGAMRDMVMDVGQNTGVTSEALAGLVGNQTFVTNNNVALALTSGNLDYNLIGSVSLGVPNVIGTTPIGSTTYTATTDGAGKLQTILLNDKKIGEEGALANLRLTVPIQVTIVNTITGSTPATTTLTFAGQFATYANAVSVPEPGSVILMTLGCLALLPIGYRRSRRRSAGVVRG